MPGKFIPLPGSAIELGEGEVMVRQYHITTNRKPKARGDVAVTNKRIVYQGKGKTSTSVKEVPIETVSAINTFQGSGFQAGKIIQGILCLIIGIVGFSTIILPILGLIFAIICFSNCFNSGYSLVIKSSAVSGTGIAVGSSDITSTSRGLFSRLFSTSGQGASLSVRAQPTAEALQMMNELGAMVMDLKTIGDKAIPKWQGYKGQPVDTSIINSDLRSAVDFGAIKDNIPNVTITPRQTQSGAQPTHPQGAKRGAPPPPPPPPRSGGNPPPRQEGEQDEKGFFS